MIHIQKPEKEMYGVILVHSRKRYHYSRTSVALYRKAYFSKIHATEEGQIWDKDIHNIVFEHPAALIDHLYIYTHIHTHKIQSSVQLHRLLVESPLSPCSHKFSDMF
jgi:hypothetical protein